MATLPRPSCFLCAHQKTPLHRDLVCGNCVHKSIEIIRNSVIENEQWNSQMRAQINCIFDVCERMKDTDGHDFKTLTATPQVSPDASKDGKASEIPRPRRNVVLQLALNLQKLDIAHRRMKNKSLEKSCESLARKNEALAKKTEALASKIESDRCRIQAAENKMLEDYSRKLESLDRELISIQFERMRRVSRQATLRQYSSYKVFRKCMFSSHAKATEPGLVLEFCDRPVLPLSQLLETLIVALNTFLEDMIRLQILLFDLFKADFDALELPYLESLKRLLPDRKFYDSVQSKIHSILRDTGEGAHMAGIAEEESACEKEPVFEDRPSEMSSRDQEKITIKDKIIHVPKSFRTMNLQRRSSVKEADASDETLSAGSGQTFQRGDKSMFVMVGEKNKKDAHGPSSQSIVNPPRVNNALPEQETALHNGFRKDGNCRTDLHGKKIVIVPHRILTKPFVKLRPNEYLRFVFVVVKILITFNELLRSILGPGFLSSFKDSQTQLCFVGGNLRTKLDDEKGAKGGFLYDFKEILLIVASLDAYFQQKLKARHQNTSSQNATGMSSSIDASQETSLNEERRSMRESWASDGGTSLVKFKNPPSKKLSRLYTRFWSKGGDPAPATTPSSVSDNVIYGMVSETNTERDEMKTTFNDGNGTGKRHSSLHLSGTGATIPDYDIKEILRNVYDLISGRAGGHRNLARNLAHLDRVGANSIMQQSRAHLEDWDMVSKMF